MSVAHCTRWTAAIACGALLLLACSDDDPGQPPASTTTTSDGGSGGGGGGGDSSGPQPLTGSWSELPPLKDGRTSFAATAVERKVIIAGGFIIGDSATKSVTVYNLEAPAEMPLTQLPEPAAGATALGHDGVVIVAGGVADLDLPVVVPHERCDRFTLADESWTPCSAVGNGPTSYAAAAIDGERAYLFGGVKRIDSSGLFPSKVVQRYHLDDDSWHAETYLPEFRDGAGAAIDGSVAHVIGGRTINEVTGTLSFPLEVLSYDLDSYAWSTDRVAPMPTARAGLACATRRGFVYCFGGYDPAGNALATVERLELASGQWVGQPPLPQPLSGPRAVAFDDAIIVLGGRDAAGKVAANVYRYE